MIHLAAKQALDSNTPCSKTGLLQWYTLQQNKAFTVILIAAKKALEMIYFAEKTRSWQRYSLPQKNFTVILLAAKQGLDNDTRCSKTRLWQWKSYTKRRLWQWITLPQNKGLTVIQLAAKRKTRLLKWLTLPQNRALTVIDLATKENKKNHWRKASIFMVWNSTR